MTVSKVLNWIKWLIGALIVGGLGNGVWEKFLSPFLTFLFEKIINLLSNISSTYSDNLYSNISESLFFNTNSRLYSTQILGIILLLAAVFIANVTLSYKEDHYKQTVFFGIFLLVFLSMTMYFSYRFSFIHKASTNSHINLEIIRPYIGEQKYFELRSSFFQIKTKKDFDSFEEKIINYSKEKNLNLQKFLDKN
jgi:hypothetical protein